MKITIDGLTVEVHQGSSLLDILSGRGEPIGHALVELNGKMVRTEDLDSVFPAEGDSVEVILPAIGG